MSKIMAGLKGKKKFVWLTFSLNEIRETKEVKQKIQYISHRLRLRFEINT